MRIQFLIICLSQVYAMIALGQNSKEEILHLRELHHLSLSDTSHHILNQEEIDAFEGLDYFEFNTRFQIEAKFTKDKGRIFKMPTSTERTPKYRRFGYLTFQIGDSVCTLTAYQNVALKKKKEYKNYLFIPFRDATSTHETYGGGRFMDLNTEIKDTMILDFNLAYNPYCAYSYRYSCPIPPTENTLNVEIRAGEKTPFGH